MSLTSGIQVPGENFKSRVTQNIAGNNGVYVIPAGAWQVKPGANTKLQYNTTGSTWDDVTAVGVGIPTLVTDGLKHRLINVHATNAENSFLDQKVR